MKRFLIIIFWALLVCSTKECFAGSPTGDTGGAGDTQQGATSGQPSCIWQGIQCGFLFGPNFNVGTDKVSSASVVNGIIRVSKDEDVTLDPLFDIHYFLTGTPSSIQTGFFGAGGAAINSGTSGTFAFGGLIQFPKNANNLYPVDLALGITIVPNTQILGSGDHANHPPPNGETSVRFESTTTFGVFVGIGVGFNLGL